MSNKEILGLHRITKKHLKELCKKHRLYQTPHLNDQLYLHYQGFQSIENLEEYTGLKCLWLETNAISEIEGLDNQTELKCLFLQNNLIKKIENLQCCPELDTLNLASNHITTIENCGVDVLPVLSTLNLSHNYLRNSDGLHGLLNCTSLWSLDLSHNRIDDILVVKIFACMPELRVLVLQGNPVVSQVPQYRKTLILECKNLTYLDSRPVFPKDRACAEAWKRGGYEEERKEHNRWVKMDRKKIRDSVNATLCLRQKHGAGDVQLLESTDEEDDYRQPKKLKQIPEEAVIADLEITGMDHSEKGDKGSANKINSSDSSSSSKDDSFTSSDNSDHEANILEPIEKVDEKEFEEAHCSKTQIQSDEMSVENEVTNVLKLVEKLDERKEESSDLRAPVRFDNKPVEIEESNCLKIFEIPYGEEEQFKAPEGVELPSDENTVHMKDVNILQIQSDKDAGNSDNEANDWKTAEKEEESSALCAPLKIGNKSVEIEEADILELVENLDAEKEQFKALVGGQLELEALNNFDYKSNILKPAEKIDKKEEESNASGDETSVEKNNDIEMQPNQDLNNSEDASQSSETVSIHSSISKSDHLQETLEANESAYLAKLHPSEPVLMKSVNTFSEQPKAWDEFKTSATFSTSESSSTSDFSSDEADISDNNEEMEISDNEANILECNIKGSDIELEADMQTENGTTEKEISDFAVDENKISVEADVAKLTKSGTFDLYSMELTTDTMDLFSESQFADSELSLMEEACVGSVCEKVVSSERKETAGENFQNSNLTERGSLCQSLDTSNWSFNEVSFHSDNSQNLKLSDEEDSGLYNSFQTASCNSEFENEGQITPIASDPSNEAIDCLENILLAASKEEEGNILNKIQSEVYDDREDEYITALSAADFSVKLDTLESKKENEIGESLDDTETLTCLQVGKKVEEDMPTQSEVGSSTNVDNLSSNLCVKQLDKENEVAGSLNDTKALISLQVVEKVEEDTLTQSESNLSTNVDTLNSNLRFKGSDKEHEAGEPQDDIEVLTSLQVGETVEEGTLNQSDQREVYKNPEVSSWLESHSAALGQKEGAWHISVKEKTSLKETESETSNDTEVGLEKFLLAVRENEYTTELSEAELSFNIHTLGIIKENEAGESLDNTEVLTPIHVREKLEKDTLTQLEVGLSTNAHTLISNLYVKGSDKENDAGESINAIEALISLQAREEVEKETSTQSEADLSTNVETSSSNLCVRRSDKGIEAGESQDDIEALTSIQVREKVEEDTSAQSDQNEVYKNAEVDFFLGSHSATLGQKEGTSDIVVKEKTSLEGEEGGTPVNTEAQLGKVFTAVRETGLSFKIDTLKSKNENEAEEFLDDTEVTTPIQARKKLEEGTSSQSGVGLSTSFDTLSPNLCVKGSEKVNEPSESLDDNEASTLLKVIDKVIEDTPGNTDILSTKLGAQLSNKDNTSPKERNEEESLNAATEAPIWLQNRLATVIEEEVEDKINEENLWLKKDQHEAMSGKPEDLAEVRNLEDEHIADRLNKEESLEEMAEPLVITLMATCKNDDEKSQSQSQTAVKSTGLAWLEAPSAAVNRTEGEESTIQVTEILTTSSERQGKEQLKDEKYSDPDAENPLAEPIFKAMTETSILLKSSFVETKAENVLNNTLPSTNDESSVRNVSLAEPLEDEPSSWWEKTLKAARKEKNLEVPLSTNDDTTQRRENFSENQTLEEKAEAFNLLESILAEAHNKDVENPTIQPKVDEVVNTTTDEHTDSTESSDDDDFYYKGESIVNANKPTPTLREILASFNAVQETITLRNQERSQLIRDLIANPLTKEISTQSGDQINHQVEEIKQEQRKKVNEMIDRVYAQKDKYDDTLEVVEGRLMVVKKSTGTLEELPPWPSLKHASCGVSTTQTNNNSDSDDYGTALSEDESDDDIDIEQHASDTKIKKIPYLSAAGCATESLFSSNASREAGEDEKGNSPYEQQFDSLQKVEKLHKKIDAEVFTEISKWMEEGTEIPTVKPTLQKKIGKEEALLMRRVLGGETNELHAKLYNDLQSFMDFDEDALEDIALIFEIPEASE